MIDKTGYEKIKIPGELEMVVQEAIVEGLSERREGNWYSRIKGVGDSGKPGNSESNL